MDAAHLHLMLNHFPLAGMLGALLILAFARWSKNETLTRTGLALVVLSGVLTLPTFLTGEPAEKAIEHLPGISEDLIEAHEEAAEKIVWLVGIAAAVSAAGLVQAFRKGITPRWAVIGVSGLGLATAVSLAWVNNLGGRISHPEIRGKTATSFRSGVMTPPLALSAHKTRS